MRAILLLMSLPAIVGLSDPINFATERRAAIIATNAAIAVSAPVSNLAANAQSIALEALARPVGTDTNAVASIAGGVLETHNESATAHTDIRASVSNAVDLASGAVRTNASGGFAIGEYAVSSGANSVAYGESAEAHGEGAWALGLGSFANGNGAFAFGGSAANAHGAFAFAGGATADSTNGVAFGAETRAIGDYAKAFGYRAIALHPHSFVFSSGYGEYTSKGTNTFCINPTNGPAGFYMGELNLQTYLDEKLSIEHDSEASAHNGRITALENRPTGLTTNTVFPFMMLSDDYSTNGVVRVAVSNGVFSIWGMK